MNKKTLWRILAVVLVVVLTLSVVTACNKNKNNGTTDDTTKKPEEQITAATSKEKQDAFFDTMFSSANEIGNGMTVDFGEGKNIAINVGTTIALALRQNGASSTLNMGISIKGFLDRTNVIAIKDAAGKTLYYEVKDTNESKIDLKITTGAVTSLRLYYDAKDGAMYVTLAGNKFKVDLSSIASNSDNTDIEEVVFNMIEDLLRNDFAYNSPIDDTDDPETTNAIDVMIHGKADGTSKGLESVVQSISNAFAGDNFDLNSVLTGLINNLVSTNPECVAYDANNPVHTSRINRYYDTGETDKEGKVIYALITKGSAHENDAVKYVLKETIGEKLLANEKPLFAGMTLKKIVTTLFGTEAQVKAFLGETFDIKGILKQVSEAMFGVPSWYIDGTEVTNYYDAKVKNDFTQAMKASIHFGGGLGSTAKQFTALNGGDLWIEFDKAAGANGSIGKMENFKVGFRIDGIANPDNVGGVTNSMEITIDVNDLKIGNTLADAGITELTATEKAAYGALYFDAGVDVTIPADMLDIVFRTYSDDAGYTVKLGGDAYGISGTTVTVPENVRISVVGGIDFTNPSGTKILLTITSGSYELARAQLEGTTVEMKIKDTELVPYILDVIKYAAGGNVGADGFDKVNGTWGFWEDGYVAIALDDGFTAVAIADAKATTGIPYYENGSSVYTALSGTELSGYAGTTVYKLNENIYVRSADATGATYVPYWDGYQGDAQRYTKNANNTYTADANGKYVKTNIYTYSPASGLAAPLTSLYQSAKVYKQDTVNNYSYEALSKVLDSFIKTGEMKVSGINIFNLLFMDNAKAKLFTNMKALTNYEATAAADEAAGTWDLLMHSLVNPSKNSGLILVLDQLIGYSSNTGTLNVGGKGIIGKIFTDNLFQYTYGGKSEKTGFYSVLGYMLERFNKDNAGSIIASGSMNIVTAYERFEKEMIDIISRGIAINEPDDDNPDTTSAVLSYVNLYRAESSQSELEKELAKWAAADETGRKAITKAVGDMGYTTVTVTGNANAVVAYPTILFQTVTSANAAELGFTVSGDTFTSNSVASIKTQYEDAVRAASEAKYYDNANVMKYTKQLFRRGTAAIAWKEGETWQFKYTKLVLDENILNNADAIISVYTEKNVAKDVVTKGGIKVTVGYCGQTLTIDASMRFMPDVYATNGQFDKSKIVFEQNLISDTAAELTLDIVKK